MPLIRKKKPFDQSNGFRSTRCWFTHLYGRYMTFLNLSTLLVRMWMKYCPEDNPLAFQSIVCSPRFIKPFHNTLTSRPPRSNILNLTRSFDGSKNIIVLDELKGLGNAATILYSVGMTISCDTECSSGGSESSMHQNLPISDIELSCGSFQSGNPWSLQGDPH